MPLPDIKPQKLTEPWGKLDRGAKDVVNAARLSLVGHCIDVCAVFLALAELPTIRRRLERAAGRALSALDIDRLSVLTFLHDLGKAGAGFYSRALSDDVRLAWMKAVGASHEHLGHVDVVAPLIQGDATYERFRQAVSFDTICAWGGSRPSEQEQLVDLWLAALSHHGIPLTTKALLGKRHLGQTWACPIEGYDPQHGLALLGQTARQLFPSAFADSQPMAAFACELVHAFAGLVSLADWIGSNTAQGFFPFDLGPQDFNRWSTSKARAHEALRSMRIDVEAARYALTQHAPSFNEVFGFAAHDTQRVTAQMSNEPGSEQVMVLEAETGSGKTEAALWRFKTLFEAGEVDSLCFLLPTRVAAGGVYRRIQAFVEQLFPDPHTRPTTVLAVPGYLRANGQDGQALPGFEVLWDDVEAHQRPLYWAAENSKRYFAGSLIAGTIDQFLLSTLQTKHAHLRASLALRALVVVDEVHASDAYMTTLLRAALARHVRTGGHALLMSATLTGEARADLLVTDRLPPQARRLRATLAPTDAPYPCISTANGIRECVGSARRKSVTVRAVAAMRDADAVASLAVEAIAQGGRVLVLRNTVTQALATQEALERQLGTGHAALFAVNGVAALHHGRYAFEDRVLLDAHVEQAFGKGAATDNAAKVLVGTQTLEISVDCDADFMITDLAPIDVLLQRLGRLHRHAQRDPHRADAMREPRLIVLTPAEGERDRLLATGATRGLGIGPRSAYDNLLAIEAAWRLVASADGPCRWEVPADNRHLVEAGASRDTLRALAESLGDEWFGHFKSIYGKQGAQASQALPLLVNWHKSWGQDGWSTLGDEVRTRLGLDGIDVGLGESWHTPLGSTIDKLTVPAWMLGPFLEGPRVEARSDHGRELALTVAGKVLIYGRWGLRLHTTPLGCKNHGFPR